MKEKIFSIAISSKPVIWFLELLIPNLIWKWLGLNIKLDINELKVTNDEESEKKGKNELRLHTDFDATGDIEELIDILKGKMRG